MASLYKTLLLALLTFCSCSFHTAIAQKHSVARRWNELLLHSIRNDFARPTVHSRNLFHASVAMYDAWAAYDEVASTYLLNHSFRGFYCPFEGVAKPQDIKAAREEAISYAMYRFLKHRFKSAPRVASINLRIESLFAELGYDPAFTSTDYTTGPPAALGNYIAEKLIALGLKDGANESRGYDNIHYTPFNLPLDPNRSGNYTIEDPNRWQPLALESFIDQGGTSFGDVPPFLSAEWGKVIPFALKEEHLKIYQKKGYDYWVYHDPGTPPLVDAKEGKGSTADYLWNFSLVSIWASHLDPDDGVMIDISPMSMGNIDNIPNTKEGIRSFYKLIEGGDAGSGYEINPKTGAPYQPQWVPRGDYTRVLAEFWADGPDSETPPGHWFSILNTVNDHPMLEKRLEGRGPVLDDLEWDVKAYLSLGGAVHDAGIAAWGAKGYYDYIRPISAIRYMCDKGQSSDPLLPRYHPAGIPLKQGYVELITDENDPLYAGGSNLHKIKLYTWRGHSNIQNPRTDKAGVGWILAENWWPYQLPNFVTPPFAGYVSGHSTFSRSAAELLSLFTGDAYFPGGMSEFRVKKNEFLKFEKGPSVDLVLQWAKYNDASDQCSLSRIWGGIHPPADDIPGRLMGQEIGIAAFQHARQYFRGEVAPEPAPERQLRVNVYPNPYTTSRVLKIKPEPYIHDGRIRIANAMGQIVYERLLINNAEEEIKVELSPKTAAGLYLVTVEGPEFTITTKLIVQ